MHRPSFASSRTPTLVPGTSPDIAPVSVSKSNVRSRPDGCCQINSDHSIHISQCSYPSREKGDYNWFNITYVEEYKKRNPNTDLNDVCPIFHPQIDVIDDIKLLWGLRYMMNIDRRRKFAFGASIENTDMRIWFCCHQIVFVTRRFDFMKVKFGRRLAFIVHI